MLRAYLQVRVRGRAVQLFACLWLLPASYTSVVVVCYSAVRVPLTAALASLRVGVRYSAFQCVVV